MTRKKSRSEAELEARLQELDPSSERYLVLSAAQRFRSSWVDLGDTLTAVREGAQFKQWGYASFEVYCRRELGLRSETANKLTRSYAFLRDQEPDALAAREHGALPPLDVVDMLSQARERTNVSDDQLQAIRREVLCTDPPAGAKPPTKEQLVKRLREVDPDAFRGPAKAKAKEPVAAPAEGDVRKAMLLAERLLGLLEAQGEHISNEAVGGVRRAVQELRGRCQEPQRKSA